MFLYGVLFFNPHLTTHQSNIGLWLRKSSNNTRIAYVGWRLMHEQHGESNVKAWTIMPTVEALSNYRSECRSVGLPYPPLRESMKHNNKGLWACMTIPLTSTPSTIINSPQHIDLSVGPPSCLMAPHPLESRLHSLKSTKRWPFVSKLNKIYELDRYWSLTLSIVWIIYLKISSLMDWKTNLYFNQEMFFTLYTHDHIFLYIQKQCHRSSYDERM